MVSLAFALPRQKQTARILAVREQRVTGFVFCFVFFSFFFRFFFVSFFSSFTEFGVSACTGSVGLHDSHLVSFSVSWSTNSMKPMPSRKAKRRPMRLDSKGRLLWVRCFLMCGYFCFIFNSASFRSLMSYLNARATGGTLSRNRSSSFTAVSLSVSDTTRPWSPSRINSSVPVSPGSFS